MNTSVKVTDIFMLKIGIYGRIDTLYYPGFFRGTSENDRTRE